MLHLSLADTVSTELRRAIINGQLNPGERLLESELAERLGVSRATVRQCLQQLSFEGLVEIRPRRGAVVTRMSLAAAMEVCEARGLLEGFAARQACEQFDEGFRRHLTDIVEQMARTVRSEDIYHFVELDIAFHDAICSRTRNRRVYDLWSMLNAQMGALMSSVLAHRHYRAGPVRDRHLKVVASLAGGSADEAERAVRAHYTDIWEDVDG